MSEQGFLHDVPLNEVKTAYYKDIHNAFSVVASLLFNNTRYDFGDVAAVGAWTVKGNGLLWRLISSSGWYSRVKNTIAPMTVVNSLYALAIHCEEEPVTSWQGFVEWMDNNKTLFNMIAGAGITIQVAGHTYENVTFPQITSVDCATPQAFLRFLASVVAVIDTNNELQAIDFMVNDQYHFEFIASLGTQISQTVSITVLE